MIDVYIIYNNIPHSFEYKDQAIASLAQCTNINVIPFEGYYNIDYETLAKDLDIRVIPFYHEFAKKDRSTVNKAFSCTASHLKVWEAIVAADRPSVVFEHDAIAKADIGQISIPEDYLVWLGPRIGNISDYNFPGNQVSLVHIDRFEGTHAYALTPKMAQKLKDSLYENGFCDSLDGILGMRNIFDLKFVTYDPPVAVAATKNRISTIETGGSCALWNSHALPGFVAGLSKGIEPPPVRQLIFSDVNAVKRIEEVTDLISGEIRPWWTTKTLVIGGYEGASTFALVNALGRDDDSEFYVLQPEGRCDRVKSGNFKYSPLDSVYQNNTYLTKYYFKITTLKVDFDNLGCVAALVGDDDLFDVVYVDGNTSLSNRIADISAALAVTLDHGIIAVPKDDVVQLALKVVGQITDINITSLKDHIIIRKGQTKG